MHTRTATRRHWSEWSRKCRGTAERTGGFGDRCRRRRRAQCCHSARSRTTAVNVLFIFCTRLRSSQTEIRPARRIIIMVAVIIIIIIITGRESVLDGAKIGKKKKKKKPSVLIFKSSGNCAFSRRIYRRAATRPVAFYYPLEKSRVHRGQYHTVISIDNTFRTQSHTAPRTKYTTAAITPTNALKTYHSTGSPRNSIYSFKPISICMRRVKDEKKKPSPLLKSVFTQTDCTTVDENLFSFFQVWRRLESIRHFIYFIITYVSVVQNTAV